MHWAMGEHEMARRANAVPFAIAAAHAEPGEFGGGRVAQRDRMLESTRVFEGRDLTTLSSPFSSVNGNGITHAPATSSALAYRTPVTIPPIKSEHTYSVYDDDEEETEQEDEDEGPRVRRRRVGGGGGGGETRLPGVAELDGEIAAFLGRGGEGRIKQEEGEGGRSRTGSM